MTWKAKLYLFIICSIGLSIACYAVLKIDKAIVLTIVLWIILATPFEIKPIRLSENLHYTLSFAIHLSLLILYGHWAAIVVAAFVTAITDLIGRKGSLKLFFNISQFSITLFLCGEVFNFLRKSDLYFVLPSDLLAFACASGLYVSVNLFLVSAIVALTQKRNVFFIIKRDFRMVILYYAALAPISMLMVLLYKEQPLTIILILPPLALAHTSFRNYAALKIETRKTLEILADLIDRRDRYTAEHSKRVAQYASAIAEEMGIDDTDKELIELAGKVHDLGKIAVSDKILLKPDKLTSNELIVINSHPDVAYSILKTLKMYKDGSIIVRAHHERYDGSGYPQGLKDKDIHIGARIMAVADAFDAMTTDRPYRKAMTDEEALQELKSNTGTQFDPKVVDAFLRVWDINKKQLEVG